jgi:DNA polymerase III delta prime subunit
VTDALEKLNPVYAARYFHLDDVGECLDGTREEPLRAILDWAQSGSAPVFWLSGPTGTGKTALVKTVCRRLGKMNMLSAGFFVNREEPRRMGDRMVQTMAYDLAHDHPEIGMLVSAAIKRRPHVLGWPVEEQLRTLIMEPLEALPRSSSPLVLVIDGINDGSQSIHQAVTLLMAFVCRRHPSVKLLLSASSENGVDVLLQGPAIEQHPLEQYAIHSDMARYYVQAFKEIALGRDVGAWPSPEDVHHLVTMTGHLFIFAVTVVDYLRDRRHHPVKRLRSLLDSRSSEALKKLDLLYVFILQDAIVNGQGYEDTQVCRRIQRLLAAIVFAATPMRVADLAQVLNTELCEMKSDLQALSSLIVFLKDDASHPIQIFHASFSDFLCDASRCSDIRFCLNPQAEHATLARRCLELVASLRSNICHLDPRPGMLNSEVVHLDQLVGHHLPPYLEYACRNWAVHASQAKLSDSRLIAAIEDFMRNFAAPWIEACSLLQCVGDAIVGLKALVHRLEVRAAFRIRSDR